MDIGDQVLYIFNDEIDLDRDQGKIIAWSETTPDFFQVWFADGFVGPIHKDDLRRIKTSQEKRMEHGFFGCLQNPCPQHNSNRENEG